MASILKSPRFARRSKRLATGAAIEVGPEAQSSVDDVAAVETAAQIEASLEIKLETLTRKNHELDAEIAGLQVKVEELEHSSSQQDYATAYEQGRQAGIDETRVELQEQTRAMASIVENLHEQGQIYLQQLEQVNVDSIFAAVRKIIGDAATDPTAVRELVRAQLNRLTSATKIVIHLAPQDYQTLLESAGEDWHSEQFQFVADDHIQYGGCIIEADGGGLDARLEIQMQQFKEMLLDVYSRRQTGEL